MKINEMQLRDFETRIAHEKILREHPKMKKIESDKDYEKHNNFLVGGEILSLNKELTTLQKQDVINSKLLAQLHANHVSNTEKTEEWYKQYKGVLEHVGYVIDSFKFDRLETSDQSLSVDTVLLEALAEIATGNQLAALKTVLDGVKELEKDGKWTPWSAHSETSNGGRFQISAGKSNAIGNAELTMGAYYTSKSDTRGSFLFISWGSLKIKVWSSAQRIELDSQVYSAVREEILEKLKDHIGNYVKALEI